ncbi:MAG: hypothetical protein RLP44_09920 [Aggregatilineales bacterium]
MSHGHQYFYFIGVSTVQSSINQVFPLWMDVLDHSHVQLLGIDHPINDAPDAYRSTVKKIKEDSQALGGLVTTHKLDLYAATSNLFDYLDRYAQITQELSCISKRDGQLRGHAKDPITAGLSLEAIIGENYFGQTGGDVLCLGAGGAAQATLLYLMNRPNPADRPKTFIAVDITEERLTHLQAMVQAQKSDIEVQYFCNTHPEDNDRLLSNLPDHSVVINATGMGKDIPGSPITDSAIFPKNGIVWEFNYRGAREFLHQASRQIELRDLQVEEGWVYFIHGWTQVIFEVLNLQMTPSLFAELDRVAASVRK